MTDYITYNNKINHFFLKIQKLKNLNIPTIKLTYMKAANIFHDLRNISSKDIITKTE